jgi:hypothetical protein
VAKKIVAVWLASEFDVASSSAPKVNRMIEIDRQYTQWPKPKTDKQAPG